jgi:mannose-6-phosphate isomerase
VGLKRGTTRAKFEEALKAGRVAECFHRIDIKAGDVMFLPSGRVHAIGGNCVIFEIQQNSDTTYRVYDWDRVGPDGKPRTLHIEQALQCIDFNDFEPPLVTAQGSILVDCPLFRAERLHTARPLTDRCSGKSFHILCGLIGSGEITATGSAESFGPGDCFLLPAELGDYQVVPAPQMTFLKVSVPGDSSIVRNGP